MRAVDILAGAASIAFFGFGASALVAMDAQQKFPPSRTQRKTSMQAAAPAQSSFLSD
jgi:hypothetical protein